VSVGTVGGVYATVPEDAAPAVSAVG
jgi:hypothetical protein